eukprot:m.15740 g.15740  ORF g.15740 m.15740 type:complete len:175 (-) comp3062_c0_seq1:62-586(-)
MGTPRLTLLTTIAVALTTLIAFALEASYKDGCYGAYIDYTEYNFTSFFMFVYVSGFVLQLAAVIALWTDSEALLERIWHSVILISIMWSMMGFVSCALAVHGIIMGVDDMYPTSCRLDTTQLGWAAAMGFVSDCGWLLQSLQLYWYFHYKQRGRFLMTEAIESQPLTPSRGPSL